MQPSCMLGHHMIDLWQCGAKKGPVFSRGQSLEEIQLTDFILKGPHT